MQSTTITFLQKKLYKKIGSWRRNHSSAHQRRALQTFFLYVSLRHWCPENGWRCQYAVLDTGRKKYVFFPCSCLIRKIHKIIALTEPQKYNLTSVRANLIFHNCRLYFYSFTWIHFPVSAGLFTLSDHQKMAFYQHRANRIVYHCNQGSLILLHWQMLPLRSSWSRTSAIFWGCPRIILFIEISNHRICHYINASPATDASTLHLNTYFFICALIYFCDFYEPQVL